MIPLSEAIPGHLYEFYDQQHEQFFAYEFIGIQQSGGYLLALAAGINPPYLTFLNPPKLAVYSDLQIKEVEVSELPIYMHMPYKSKTFERLIRGEGYTLPQKNIPELPLYD